jgi:hypothetical protein
MKALEAELEDPASWLGLSTIESSWDRARTRDLSPTHRASTARRSTTDWRAACICCSPRAATTSGRASLKRANTVILGLGHATLTAVNGAVPLTVVDVPGVIIAGVTIDASTVESPVLLEVGKKNDYG